MGENGRIHLSSARIKSFCRPKAAWTTSRGAVLSNLLLRTKSRSVAAAAVPAVGASPPAPPPSPSGPSSFFGPRRPLPKTTDPTPAPTLHLHSHLGAAAGAA
jgi:hypothetical protein